EVLESGARWDLVVPLVVAGYNATKHAALKVSPFEAMFGDIFRFPEDAKLQLELNRPLQKKPKEDMKAWLLRLKEYLDMKHGQIEVHRARYNARRMLIANRGRHAPTWKVDDVVLRKVEGKVGNPSKFGPKWYGPYRITRIRGNNVSLQRLDDASRDNANMTKIKKWFPPAMRNALFEDYRVVEPGLTDVEKQIDELKSSDPNDEMSDRARRVFRRNIEKDLRREAVA
ncbi:MAG: hypothetical protein GY714_16445, partial [Desulfobacterales bacterium]|nr:hypothetical protein [Desulfobacterales bacterium]